MKFSVNWLRELTPFTWSAQELAERLTMAGVELEGTEVQGQGMENVVVAQILKSEQHPNADRLSVCEVDVGSGKKQIVCGAKNYKVGDKVPLALPGAKLPNGMEIKRSKLRGVESDGMMCSPKELGLATDSEGLMILPMESPIGQPLTQLLGLNDTLLELEITPNRPDLLSHWGMAREIAAIAELPSPNPRTLLAEDREKQLLATMGSAPVPIHVEAPAECPRYTARVIRNVKVGPSPAWLRNRLASLGHRSISNVVDITNYILEEMGQPLHAFDLKLLQGPEIIVRMARAGEKMVRLDDLTSEIQPEMLVIADASRPVAIAGVMGGKDTGVSETTTDILLESATFQPASVRKTSKRLALSSDSSYRFERGVDVELAAWANHRATTLILELCGGHVDGPLIDVRAPPPTPRAICCRFSRVDSVIGKVIPPDEVVAILRRIGCEAQPSSDACTVTPPSFRHDLEREIDLIEEITRIHGIEKIPGRLSASPLSTTRDSEMFLFARKLRALASGLGLDEAITYSIQSSRQAAVETATFSSKTNILANPVTSEMDAMRPSLFSGLLEVASRNLAGGNAGIALFEIGNIFPSSGSKLGESTSLGILLAGLRTDGASWEKGVSGKRYDFHDLKGAIEGLLASLHLNVSRRVASAEEAPIFEPGLGFALHKDNKVVGMGGLIRGSILQSRKCPSDIFYAELDCTWLASSQEKVSRYQPWAVYPAIRRDIALTVSVNQKHEKIAETLQGLSRKHADPKGIFLQDVELFDIFSSEKLGADKKSLAYSLVYRSPDRTLTDTEVNEVHEAIKTRLKDEIACEIRE